jgi:hypothetical protein
MIVTKMAKMQKLLLPALILTTPFLVFLNYNSYGLACAETWILLGGLILFATVCSVVMLLGGSKVSGLMMAALITAFIDLQFTPTNLPDWVDEWTFILLFAGMQTFVLCLFLKEKFYTIATAIFLTFFIVTLLQSTLPSKDNDSLFEHHESAVRAPPRIIHLVLDEHIGIEGIPTDIDGGLATKNLITQFYLKNGFQLFGGAFSHYFNTHISIPSMLNFSGDIKNTPYVSVGRGFALSSNNYFGLLSQKKYNIDVLSSAYLNFCFSKVVIAECQYDFGTLHTFAKLELATSQKLQVLASRYLDQSSVVSFLIRKFVLPHEFLRSWTWAFELDRTRLNSLSTLYGLKVLWNDIASLPQGTALFAHLMIPHSPYVANADCSIRPPNREFLWYSTNKFSSADGPTNTVASRRDRYKLYFEQLSCLYLRLDELFDRMRAVGAYDDSIIILHGDHGSRIGINEPTSRNQQALTNQDVVDGFSTLFAMKLPSKPGGYDKLAWPLEELFARFVFEAGLTSTNILPGKSEPYVYLLVDHDRDPIRIPYVPLH